MMFQIIITAILVSDFVVVFVAAGSYAPVWFPHHHHVSGIRFVV